METQQKLSDDVDLGQFFAGIGSFFSKVGHGIMVFLAFLRNTPHHNKALFLVLVVIMGGLGAVYSAFVKKNFYESSMILSSEYLNKRIVENSVDKLNLLAKEEGPRGLAIALRLPDSIAKTIAKFEAEPFIAEQEVVKLEILKEQLKNAQANAKNQNLIDQVIKQITIENQHAFEFKIRTFSPTVIKALQDALVNYFKNNAYISKRIQISHDILVDKKSKLVRESHKLDSLKEVIYFNYKTMAEGKNRQGSGNVILGDKPVTDPIDVFNEDLAIYEQIQSIDRTVFLQPDFEVVDGFTEFSEPASASMIKIIVTGMLIGFVLGYVVVSLKRFDNYLSRIK